MADSSRWIHRYSLPQMVERGTLATSVLAEIRDVPSGDPTLLVPGVWTYSIYSGSRLVYETSSGISAGGGFLAHSIPGSALEAEPLSDRMQERWSGTISGTPDQVFTRPFMLVRHELQQAIADDDLTALHSDLLDLIDPDQTNFGTQRQTAWELLQKWLIMKGNRPQLILDDWAVRDAHRYLSLHIIFSDFATSVGPDGRYRQLADHYKEKARTEFDSIHFAYDFDQDGFDDGTLTEAANPVTLLQIPWGY